MNETTKSAPYLTIQLCTLMEIDPLERFKISNLQLQHSMQRYTNHWANNIASPLFLEPISLTHLCQTLTLVFLTFSPSLFLFKRAPHAPILPLGHLASSQLHTNKRYFHIILSLIVTANLEDDVPGMCWDWLLGNRLNKLDDSIFLSDLYFQPLATLLLLLTSSESSLVVSLVGRSWHRATTLRCSTW